MGIACWITKATDTHTECVILIAFLHGNSVYAKVPQRYTHRACLVILSSYYKSLWLQKLNEQNSENNRDDGMIRDENTRPCW